MEKQMGPKAPSGYVFSRSKTAKVKWSKLPVMRTAKGHTEKLLKDNLSTRNLGGKGRLGLEVKFKF